MHNFSILTFVLVGVLLVNTSVSLSCAQSITASAYSDKVITISPSTILNDPDQLNNFWVYEPVPLSFYTSDQIAMQKMINRELTDVVVTFSSDQQWTAIDSIEITPYTWKWIDLEMSHADGSVTRMSLRRPSKWIQNKQALPGNQVYFEWEEVGAAGWATVVRVRPNQLDTRLDEKGNNDFVAMPIIGKFIHTSNNVFDLSFNEGKPVGVTATHPIWSADRQAWVSVIDLRVGERVQTNQGIVSLSGREARPGEHTVYNIEVYRSHNYFVSSDQLLVHNGPVCDVTVGGRSVAEVMGDATITVEGRVYNVVPTSENLRLQYVEGYAKEMREKTFDWNNMTDLMSVDKKLMAFDLYPNGVAVLREGHTRYVASRLAGVSIDVKNEGVVSLSFHTNPYQGGSGGWQQVKWGNSPSDRARYNREQTVRKKQ